MCAKRDNVVGSGANNIYGGDDRKRRSVGGEEMSWSGSEEPGSEEDEVDNMDVDEESGSDWDDDELEKEMEEVVADVVEVGSQVVEVGEKMENRISVEDDRKGGLSSQVPTPAKKGTEVEADTSEVDGDESDRVGDEMDADGKDGSTDGRVDRHIERTLASKRPKRTIKPPDRLHQDHTADWAGEENDRILSDYDDTAAADEPLHSSAHVLKHIAEAESDSEFDPDQSVLRKGVKKSDDNEKNGKIIKPELNGWAQIAAPMYYVYLQRSVPTGHWYIGYTSKPWTRLLEHNEIIGNGQNLGDFTRDPSKRPWKIMLLVEGFENNIEAQGFEQTWARRHPDLQEDRSSDVGRFIENLIYLLHKQKAARHLLDIRFFDGDTMLSWQRHVAGGYYRQAPLKIIDNVHEDVPGWDKDKTSERFKNHPLQIMKREVRDYSLHHEHMTRGRRLITESNAKHTCTICDKVINDDDGKGRAIFEHGTDGPVTPTPLMVLCPSEGCTAVSHMTCLAHQHFEDEKNAGNPKDYEHITLPIPISGKCRTCGNNGDWKDYRREIIARLKASHEYWRKIWRRQSLNHKATRIAERRKDEASRGLDVIILQTAREYVRPGVCQDGIRQKIIPGPADATLAIQRALCGQVVTGDIHKLVWYEKMILGDHICIERKHEWCNNHIDNHEHIKFLPVQDDIFNNHVSMADLKNFLDASSIYWAHWENSRAEERGRKDMIPVDVDDKDAWRRRKGPGKGVFKENDTYWMWEDDMAKRTALGGAWLDEVAFRGTNASPAVAAEMAQLAEAARERAARILWDAEYKQLDTPRREREDEVELERHMAIRQLRKEQEESQRLLNSAKPPKGIIEQLRCQREEMKRLKCGVNQRESEMARRRVIAKLRCMWRARDNTNAVKRKRIRHLIERKRRWTLAGTPTAGSVKRRLGPRRNKPKTRVRYVDDPVETTDTRTRSGFQPVPGDESSEDEDIQDYDGDLSGSGSESSDSEDDNPGLSPSKSSRRSSSAADDSDGPDDDLHLTHVSASKPNTNLTAWEQEQLRLMGLYMERSGYQIDAAEPNLAVEAETLISTSTHDGVDTLQESASDLREQHSPLDTAPSSKSSSPEARSSFPPHTPKKKRTPKEMSPAKRARHEKRKALLATPPPTPRRRARPGPIPPYVEPTPIYTPGIPRDIAERQINAELARERKAYDDRYYPVVEVKKGRRCFEG